MELFELGFISLDYFEAMSTRRESRTGSGRPTVFYSLRSVGVCRRSIALPAGELAQRQTAKVNVNIQVILRNPPRPVFFFFFGGGRIRQGAEDPGQYRFRVGRVAESRGLPQGRAIGPL